MIDEDEADPKSRLGRLYKLCVEPDTGTVDEVLKIHGLRPETLDAHLRLYKSAMRPHDLGGLSGRERELIAVAVSIANDCRY